MNFLSSLDAKDRKLLLWCVGIALALAVATGFLMPASSDKDNPLPSSYLAGQHGARAAYETLLRSGYPIERWERPLSELAAEAGPETVVILAEPFSREPEEMRAVRKIVERGGRVLATGYRGGAILPGEASRHARKTSTWPPASWSRRDWIRWPGRAKSGWCPRATWAAGNPAARVAVQLRRQSSGGGVRLGQGPHRLVGRLDAAGERLA